jgi:hypothetical protein
MLPSWGSARLSVGVGRLGFVRGSCVGGDPHPENPIPSPIKHKANIRGRFIFLLLEVRLHLSFFQQNGIGVVVGGALEVLAGGGFFWPSHSPPGGGVGSDF